MLQDKPCQLPSKSMETQTDRWTNGFGLSLFGKNAENIFVSTVESLHIRKHKHIHIHIYACTFLFNSIQYKCFQSKDTLFFWYLPLNWSNLSIPTLLFFHFIFVEYYPINICIISLFSSKKYCNQMNPIDSLKSNLYTWAMYLIHSIWQRTLEKANSPY